MKTSIFLITTLVMVSIPGFVYGEAWIPENEIVTYFDSNGIFTIGANVRNHEGYAIKPTITIEVRDGDNIITKRVDHIPIPSMRDIPFKTKFPELSSEYPELLDISLGYVQIEKPAIPLEVIYDTTLITHSDGHVTGRMQNVGEHTIYHPKMLALVHGEKSKVLDVAQNIEYFEKIEPGEILDFSIYPDPSIIGQVVFYSCFAPTDTMVIPVSVNKNGEKYDFRYDSGSWYAYAQFNEDGTVLTMRTQNSYPIPTYANFEFPLISEDEKFGAYLNDKPINFIQSLDEMGFWHVAFNVEPRDSGILKITGFAPGLPPNRSPIPDWVKTNADAWIKDEISDSEFLENIQFLIQKGVINIPSRQLSTEENWVVPYWLKNTTQWWLDGWLTEDEYLQTITFLVDKKIIVV